MSVDNAGTVPWTGQAPRIRCQTRRPPLSLPTSQKADWPAHKLNCKAKKKALKQANKVPTNASGLVDTDDGQRIFLAEPQMDLMMSLLRSSSTGDFQKASQVARQAIIDCAAADEVASKARGDGVPRSHRNSLLNDGMDLEPRAVWLSHLNTGLGDALRMTEDFAGAADAYRAARCARRRAVRSAT